MKTGQFGRPIPWPHLFRRHISDSTHRGLDAVIFASPKSRTLAATFGLKIFAPDLSQSILPALVFRSRLAAGLRALFPIKDIGKVDEVYFFLQGSNFGFVYGHLPPKTYRRSRLPFRAFANAPVW